MTSETRKCQSCEHDFSVEPEDFRFYEKIGVPPPTFCPECRNIRRLAWREEKKLYHGTCKLCGKSTLSVYAPGGPFTIYCRSCWVSDKWDPMDYGREYDFSKPFFLQYRELMEAVPRSALTGVNVINSEYTHASINLKNCYLLFWSVLSEDSQYGSTLLFAQNTFDSFTTDNSDHAYEALHSDRLYRVSFVYFSQECVESSFLLDCVGCTYCFGCINLRKQKYRIVNEQLSKEEYHERIKYWDLGSYKRLEEAKEKFKKLYLSLPHRYAFITNASRVSGDIIRDTKDCENCFTTLKGIEKCKHVFFGGLNLKDSYDVVLGGDLSELLYETVGVTKAQRTLFSAGSGGGTDVQYANYTSDSHNVFGCIGLKNKQWCILNKQYDKETFQKLKAKIIAQMN